MLSARLENFTSRWEFFLDKKKNPVPFKTQGLIYISLTKTSYGVYYADALHMLHAYQKYFEYSIFLTFVDYLMGDILS